MVGIGGSPTFLKVDKRQAIEMRLDFLLGNEFSLSP